LIIWLRRFQRPARSRASFI
jgi:hypothetical protein